MRNDCIAMAPSMVRIGFVFISFKEKLLLSTFNKGEKSLSKLLSLIDFLETLLFFILRSSFAFGIDLQTYSWKPQTWQNCSIIPCFQRGWNFDLLISVSFLFAFCLFPKMLGLENYGKCLEAILETKPIFKSPEAMFRRPNLLFMFQKKKKSGAQQFTYPYETFSKKIPVALRAYFLAFDHELNGEVVSGLPLLLENIVLSSVRRVTGDDSLEILLVFL